MGKLIAPVVPVGTLAHVDQPELAIDDDLVLRPFRHADAATVVEAFTTPDIQHWHFRSVATEEEAIGWIEGVNAGWRQETSATWAIVERASTAVIGRVTIRAVLEDGYGSVSYWVLPVARGRGAASRACVAATRWAHELGLHRVELEHSTRNEASGRVARRAGFKEEGVRRGANLHDDGWHDMRLYAHLSTDPY